LQKRLLPHLEFLPTRLFAPYYRSSPPTGYSQFWVVTIISIALQTVTAENEILSFAAARKKVEFA
jgi:hypothetical protein